MGVLARIFRGLPSMVPVAGIITLGVVLGWGRYFASVTELVCQASIVLNPGGECAVGSFDAERVLQLAQGVAEGSKPPDCITPAAIAKPGVPCSDASPNPGNQRYVVRLQAQGSGLQKSVVFDQNTPVTAAQALVGLDNLKAQLTKGELSQRDQALVKAAKWIRAAAAAGGVGPPGKSGFTNPGVRGKVARIDVEVQHGVNLVP